VARVVDRTRLRQHCVPFFARKSAHPEKKSTAVPELVEGLPKAKMLAAFVLKLIQRQHCIYTFLMLLCYHGPNPKKGVAYVI
jgi:hypothetical protein